MKKSVPCGLIAAGVALALAGPAAAAPTFLALRLGNQGTCAINAATKQIVTSTFGANLCSLPFTGTTTYHFYSPPLATSVNLTTADKGGGMVFMRNISTNSSDDFTVVGRMRYYDYDAVSNTDVLIVDSAASPHKHVRHGQTVNWAIHKVALPAGKTIPAGHLLHVAVTIYLISGNPGSYGQLLFNGDVNSSTSALFPQNNLITWSYSPVLSLALLPDNAAILTCLGAASTNYVIEACTNLTVSGWVTVCTNATRSDGMMSYVVMDLTSYPCRFYRIKPTN